MGYQSMHPAGGLWYSHPEAGECKDGHFVGDGSGCTWRVVQRTNIVNASCVYERLDSHVVNADPGCFSACPQPNNVTSSCYLKCYSAATLKMSHDDLASPWAKAFASQDPSKGGCPAVHHAGEW